MKSDRVALLGVDGGGTKTVAWVADAFGTVLGRGHVDRPANQKAVGFVAAADAILCAIDRAYQDAGERLGMQISGAEVACFGLAGFDRPEDKGVLIEWAGSQCRFGRLVLVNDGELVLAAGTPEGWGVGVIAGTGSIAVGRDPSGNSARAGGWGHVFGDEGSGYGVGVAALRRVAGRFDGRSPGGWQSDVLSSFVCDAVGVADPSGLVGAVYAAGFDRPKIAALASSVVRAAELDAEIVREILEPAGRALGQAARAVAERLDLPREGLPLAVAGGFVLSCEAAWLGLRDELMRSGFRPVMQRVDEPVAGALILAGRASSQ